MLKSADIALPQRGGIVAYWRLLHPVPSLMTVLAAGAFVLLAARGLPPLGLLLHVLVIETAMQFSISAANDYFDRTVDKGREDKPVATGAITPGVASGVASVLGTASVLLALPLGVWVTALTAIGLAGGLLYDAGLKYTALSWLPFSIAFPTLPLWAWAGVHPDGGFPARLWWVVPVAGVLVLGIHLADTIPDIARDTEAGVRGVAHRLGLHKSLALCWGAFGGALLLTLALWSAIPYRLEWYIPGLVASAILMLSGVLVYLSKPQRVKIMSLLMEMGAIVLAVGWLGAVML